MSYKILSWLIIFCLFLAGCTSNTPAPANECSLSLCDCKCHPKGQTPDDINKTLCGINCLGEKGVAGCEYKDGKCTEVYSNDTKDCNSDDDCSCGVSTSTGDCFYGNKRFVNASKQCPDYCTGIGGNLAVKCLNNTCAQVNARQTCSSDKDCVPEQCCHPTTCINKNYKTPCNVLCTQSCQGPIDCGAGRCGCIDGKCSVKASGGAASA